MSVQEYIKQIVNLNHQMQMIGMSASEKATYEAKVMIENRRKEAEGFAASFGDLFKGFTP